MRWQSVSSAARKSSPAAPCTTARIEAVLGAEHGLERVAGPVLDRALDDDVKKVRGASLLDDDFVTTEIADVERCLEFFNLLVGQAIEGRVESVKSLHPRR